MRILPGRNQGGDDEAPICYEEGGACHPDAIQLEEDKIISNKTDSPRATIAEDICK